jgi:hypothetical protein
MMRTGWLMVLGAAVFAAGCGEQARSPAEPDGISIPVRIETSQHAGAAHNFRTHLSGGEEVPSNDSRAQGQANFQLSRDGSEMSYKLIVANIENVTQAHIHLGPAGVNGMVIVWLYPAGPPAQLIPGRSQGVLAEGVITSDSLVGPMAGQTLDDLLEQMRAGNTYVNVHTSQFLPGEVRGQIH